MGKPRSQLSAILHKFCSNVYFQPPTGTMLSYPCIVYQLEDMEILHADNAHYGLHDRYSMTYITRDPDDANRHAIIELPYCSFDRFYASDNLNHYSYTIYF